jgi:predicted nucleic acid-binding protein
LAFLLDTNVAIHLRDGDPETRSRLAALGHKPKLSIISHVELEGGVYAKPEFSGRRRAAVDSLIKWLGTIDFDKICAAAYSHILADAGYSRRKVNDRMIAATALAHDLTLITMNGDDFRDVSGLKLEVWT